MKRFGRITGKILLGFTVIFTLTTLILVGTNYQRIGNALSTYGIVNNYFYEKVDQQTLWDGISEGLVQGLGDPYSEYITKDEYEAMSEKLQGGFAGIGIYFTVDEDGAKVVSVFDDSPAEKAGLREGHIMLQADAQSLEGLEMDEISVYLKGPEGTSFDLLVKEEDASTKTLTLTRAFVDYETLYGTKIADSNLGYIYLSSFTMKTPEQFRETLIGLGDIDGLVIDLRNNGGGQTTGAYGVAALFLPEGPIVFEETRRSISAQEASGGNLEMPLAVLVNENTASASEILAGAIQDTDRGQLIGSNTFGKGTVQRFFRTLNGDYVKITIARYLTPAKRSLHGEGLKPDVEVLMDEEATMRALYGEDAPNPSIDPQLQKAMDMLS